MKSEKLTHPDWDQLYCPCCCSQVPWHASNTRMGNGSNTFHYCMYRLILFNTLLQQGITSTLTCSCMVTRQSWSTSNFLDRYFIDPKFPSQKFSISFFELQCGDFSANDVAYPPESRSTVVVARRRVYSYHQHLCAAVLFLIGVSCSRKTMQRCALLNMNQLYFHNFRKKESKVWLCHTKK